MIDIVQLIENGKKKYLKTHVDAVDGLKDAVVSKVGNETVLGTKNFRDGLLLNSQKVIAGETEWKTLDPLTGSGAMNKDFRIKREGSIVTLVATWTSDSTTGQKSILAIPEGFRAPLSRLPVPATNMSSGKTAYSIIDSSTLKVSVDTGNNSFAVMATWMTNDAWPV